MRFQGIILALVSVTSTVAYAQPVKLTNSGLCHTSDSPYYSRIRHAEQFSSMQLCLHSGGHAYQGSSQKLAVYQRGAFGGWIDADKDCQNTRHELLSSLSTGTIKSTSNGCRITRGRWHDPYTNQVFYDARKLDIDHLVPLKWAWQHGADRWSEQRRERFANDPRNLLAVSASANRQKGASGPLEWLPPNGDYQCQYLVRFLRVSQSYQLTLNSSEQRAFSQLRKQLCG